MKPLKTLGQCRYISRTYPNLSVDQIAIAFGIPTTLRQRLLDAEKPSDCLAVFAQARTLARDNLSLDAIRKLVEFDPIEVAPELPK